MVCTLSQGSGEGLRCEGSVLSGPQHFRNDGCNKVGETEGNLCCRTVGVQELTVPEGAAVPGAPCAGGAECCECRQDLCSLRNKHLTEKSLCLLCAADIASFTHTSAITAQCLLLLWFVSTTMLDSSAVQGQAET